MNRRPLITRGILAALIIFLFMVPVLIGSRYWIHVLILSVINALLAVSLRFISRIGLLSMGHASFMLVGAYSSAILVMNYGLSFWISLPLSGLMAGFVALALGYPFVRAKGLYFAILTLIAGEVLRLVAWYWTSITGGVLGLLGVPSPSPIVIPGVTTITFDTKTAYYYLVLVIFLVCVIVLNLLERSRLGLTWGAIREADSLAETVGINVMWHKIIVFAIGSFFAGISGAMFAHFTHILSCGVDGKFGLMTSIFILIYMVVGGEASIVGPIMGAVILTLIPEFSRPLSEYQPILFGGLLVFIALFMPGGLMSLPDRFTVFIQQIAARIRKQKQLKLRVK